MIKRFVINQILKSILSSMKGKKRWLIIIVLVVANVLQAAGVADFQDFVNELMSLLEASPES